MIDVATLGLWLVLIATALIWLHRRIRVIEDQHERELQALIQSGKEGRPMALEWDPATKTFSEVWHHWDREAQSWVKNPQDGAPPAARGSQ